MKVVYGNNKKNEYVNRVYSPDEYNQLIKDVDEYGDIDYIRFEIQEIDYDNGIITIPLNFNIPVFIGIDIIDENEWDTVTYMIINEGTVNISKFSIDIHSSNHEIRFSNLHMFLPNNYADEIPSGDMDVLYKFNFPKFGSGKPNYLKEFIGGILNSEITEKNVRYVIDISINDVFNIEVMKVNINGDNSTYIQEIFLDGKNFDITGKYIETVIDFISVYIGNNVIKLAEIKNYIPECIEKLRFQSISITDVESIISIHHKLNYSTSIYLIYSHINDIDSIIESIELILRKSSHNRHIYIRTDSIKFTILRRVLNMSIKKHISDVEREFINKFEERIVIRFIKTMYLVTVKSDIYIPDVEIGEVKIVVNNPNDVDYSKYHGFNTEILSFNIRPAAVEHFLNHVDFSRFGQFNEIHIIFGKANILMHKVKRGIELSVLCMNNKGFDRGKTLEIMNRFVDKLLTLVKRRNEIVIYTNEFLQVYKKIKIDEYIVTDSNALSDELNECKINEIKILYDDDFESTNILHVKRDFKTLNIEYGKISRRNRIPIIFDNNVTIENLGLYCYEIDFRNDFFRQFSSININKLKIYNTSDDRVYISNIDKIGTVNIKKIVFKNPIFNYNSESNTSNISDFIIPPEVFMIENVDAIEIKYENFAEVNFRCEYNVIVYFDKIPKTLKEIRIEGVNVCLGNSIPRNTDVKLIIDLCVNEEGYIDNKIIERLYGLSENALFQILRKHCDKLERDIDYHMRTSKFINSLF